MWIGGYFDIVMNPKTLISKGLFVVVASFTALKCNAF